MAMARSGTALVLILLASAVLNTAIFPEVALVSPFSRDLSTVCGACFSVLVAAAAYLRPQWIRAKAWSAVLLALLAGSLIALYFGIVYRNDGLVIVGSPFGGVGMVWFSVLLGVALTRLPLRETFVVVPAAYVVSYGARFAFALASDPLPLSSAAIIYFVAIAASYLLIAEDIRPTMEALRCGESPTVLDATNPSSFLPFSSFIYMTVLIFNAACGFEMAQTGGTLPPTGELLSFLPVALVLVAALARPRGPFALDALHGAASLLVFAGLLLIPLRLAPADGLNLASLGPAVLLRGGSDVFMVLTYFLVAAIGSRNPTGALTASAFAFSASWLGIVVGTTSASCLEGLASQGDEAILLATAAVTFAFVAYNFVFLRRRSFDGCVSAVVPAYAPLQSESKDGARLSAECDAGIIDARQAAEGHGGDTPCDNALRDAPSAIAASSAVNDALASDDARIDRGCATVAARFGLTSREEDVLALLARGRTSPVIQRKLTVSHNTVKSHVRHIYAKLGVHSQQELIDLVDEAAASSL